MCHPSIASTHVQTTLLKRLGRTVTVLADVVALVVLSVVVAYVALVKNLESNARDPFALEHRVCVQNERQLTVLLPHDEERKGMGLAGSPELP